MTDDEIIQIAKKQTGESKTFEEWALSFARVIIPAQPEPEPVAYINVEERKLEWATPMRWETPTVVKMDKVPLYTAPPQPPQTQAGNLNAMKTELWKPEPDCYGDGNVYRGVRNKDSEAKTIYLDQPQREWVELTKNELAAILCDERYQFRTELMLLAAQTKLKEKNIF
jgi:hypothetical protein